MVAACHLEFHAIARAYVGPIGPIGPIGDERRGAAVAACQDAGIPL